MKNYIMALDEGTTGVRAILFNREGQPVSDVAQEFTQIFPQPGWIEHNAEEILQCQIDVARKAIAKAKISPDDIAAIGITNQRETAVVWDKNTGKPIYNAIVWGSRQTAEIIEEWKAAGLDDEIRDKTGLINDAYFSASKIVWILDHVEGARARAEKGELLFGNIDTWLIWNLTGRKSHVTDYSNASRTMVFNIRELKWDKDLCRKMNVPLAVLPTALPSSGEFGVTDPSIFGAKIPILGDAGDQQAALFGQACFKPGMAKNTFGTAGVFVMNIGDKPFFRKGLTTTIAWGLNGKVSYALEGVIFVSGATVQWVRDNMRLIRNSADTEWYGNMVPDTGGVYLVPAFSGLCAPYWDMYARGIIVGITRGTTSDHLIRAALEAMAYQTKDIIDTVLADGKISIPELRVDGGATKNNLLCQFQANILGFPVVRPKVTEMTALGAAYLAGLACGFWKSTDEISEHWGIDRVFQPAMSEARRKELYGGWQEAVQLTRGWTTKVEQHRVAEKAAAETQTKEEELVGV
jgi:glycerol kinase